MANFKEQVNDLTGFSATDDTALADWLKNACSELLQAIGPEGRGHVSTTTSFTNTQAITTSWVNSVTRSDGTYDRECALITSEKIGEAQDPNSMLYATQSYPAYYWADSSTITLLPSGSGKVNHVSIPTPAVTDNSITNFPDNYEHLVVLHASMSAIIRQMTDMQSNSDITEALTQANASLDLMDTELTNSKTQLDAAEVIIDKQGSKLDDVYDTTQLWDNTNKRFQRVKDAISKAELLIDDGANVAGDNAGAGAGNTASAQFWLSDEDTDMVSSTISIASQELSRAQNSMQEINGLIQSATSYSGPGGDTLKLSSEHLSRAGTLGNQASSYLNEASGRLAIDTQRYTWLEGRHAKLAADYQRGLAAIGGGGAD